jgi:tartrate-resistant acid phosphatase type 5
MSLVRITCIAAFFAVTAGQQSYAQESGAAPEPVETPPVEAEAIEAPSVSFIAVGDTGYEGSWFDFFGSWYGVRGQHWAPGRTGLLEMAEITQNYCKANPCDFGVMAGDNIYPDGVAGEDAEEDQVRYTEVFEKPFAPLLDGNSDFRIFPAMGNHDWRGKRKGATAQLAYLRKTPPFDMRDFFYKATPANSHGLADIFVIDTEMMLSQLTVYDHHLKDDGSEARDLEDKSDAGKNTRPLMDAEQKQREWLTEALKASTAKWKIVVAHHPLWSSGSTKFEQAHALRKYLLPTLCENADAYIAGHEHTMEVHADSCETVMPEGEAKPLLHVVSGAFSKSRLLNPAFKAYQDKRYPQLHSVYTVGKRPEGSQQQYMQTWGFAHLTLKGDTATVRMITHIEDEALPTEIKPVFECEFIRGTGFPDTGCATK